MINKELSKSIVGWLGAKKLNNQNRHKWVKWIIGIGIAIIAFFVLSYISYVHFMKWYKLAQLEHEKDVLEQNRIRAKEDQKVADLEKDFDAATKKINNLTYNIAITEDKINKLKEELKNDKGKISAIENWDDITNFARASGLDK